MIIDSPIISGSSAASGSLNQFGNIIITGSLTVTGAITGAVTGSVDSASYASNAELLDGRDSTTFTSTSSFQNYTSSNDAQVLQLNNASASLNSYTSSNNANIAALNAATASLYNATSSIYTATASLNSYTSSNNNSIADIRVATASLYAATASINSYTASNNANIAALYAATASIYLATASLNAATASLNQYTQSLNLNSSSFATTGSNTFVGANYFSNSSNAISFTSTGSLYSDGGMRITKDMYVSGTAYFNNVTVFGTQSVNYITSSQLNIASNIITVNTSTPVVRFGGLAVYDSGSLGTGLTGSILWDSENNHWVYSNPSGSSYSGGMFISGPRSSALGSEQGTTNNALMKGQGGDHITSSMVFEVSGSVGVGYDSPSVKLDVYGVIATRTSAFTYSTIDGATDGNLYITANAGQANTTNSNTIFRLSTSGGSITESMRISNNGNVGIGTTTIDTKLVIAGNNDTATANNTLRFVDTDTSTQANQQLGKIEFYSSDASSPGAGVKAYIGAFADDTTPDVYLAFATDTSTGTPIERIRVASDGNVGIGTNNPTSKLHILYSGDDNAGIRLQGDATDNTLEFRTNNNVAHIQAYTASAFGTGATLAINASGGSVGIGTTSPNANLHIYGTAERRYFNIDAIAGFAGIGSGSDAMVMMNNTGDGNTLLIRTANSARTDAAPFAVWTDNNSRFIILNNGSVGIGSSTPTSGIKLDVIGKIRATDDLVMAQTSPVISFDSGSAGALRFFSVSGSAERMRITSKGDVGIGTTSPVATANYTFVTTDGVGGSGYITRVNGTTSAYFYSNATDTRVAEQRSFPLIFETAGTERTRITSDGMVGINTTSPVSTNLTGSLTIRKVYGADGGSVPSTTAQNYYENQSGLYLFGRNSTLTFVGAHNENSEIFFANPSSKNSAVIGVSNGTNSAGGSMYFNTGGNERRITILNTGNIGINTTSPGAYLEITDEDGGQQMLRVRNYNTPSTGNFNGHYMVELRSAWTTGASSGSLLVHSQEADDTRAVMAVSDSNGIFARFVNGKVGIGTTSPGYKLDVNGTFNTSGNTTLAGTGQNVIIKNHSNYPWFEGQSASAQIFFGRSGTNPWAIGADATYAFRLWDSAFATGYLEILASNGNVGIGSTAPAYKLDVNGTTRTTGNTILASSGNYVSIGGAPFYAGTSVGSLSIKGDLYPGIAFYTGSNSSDQVGQIFSYAGTGNMILAADPRGIMNSTTMQFELDGSTKMLINASGNVGIGTTSPAATLDVTGSSVDMVIPVPGTFVQSIPFTINSVGTARNMVGNAGGYNFGDQNILSLIAADDATTQLALWKASDTATGSLGGSRLIGFGSRGTMALPGSVGNNDVVFSVEGYAIHGSGPNRGKFGAGMRFVKDDNFGTANTYAPQRTEFYNAVDTVNVQTNMTILPNGSVGIGTTSPISKLHVAGDMRTVLTSTAGGDTLISAIAGVSNGYRILVDTSNNITYSWNTGTNTTAMTINSGGNVGIGTTSPKSRLDVNGTIGLTNGATRTYSATGDITITITGLQTLNGNNWRQAGGTILYQGVQGNLSDATTLFCIFRLQGLNTWDTLSVTNITGTTTLTLSNATTTGCTLTLDVANAILGSALVQLIDSNSGNLS